MFFSKIQLPLRFVCAFLFMFACSKITERNMNISECPLKSIKVAGGIGHSCSILESNFAKCWGLNNNGQLGLGDNNTRGNGPNEMGNSLAFVDLGDNSTANFTDIDIASGSKYTCVILNNGRIKCWGLNNFGQLGLGDDNTRGDGPNEMGNSLPFVDLGSNDITNFTTTDIAAGKAHTCVILNNGRVKCWGLNNHGGQLGLGDDNTRGDDHNEMGNNLPFVDLGHNSTTNFTAVNIAAGGLHTCVILNNGGVKCLGWNGNGQLGLGDVDNRGYNSSQMGNNLPFVDLGIKECPTMSPTYNPTNIPSSFITPYPTMSIMNQTNIKIYKDDDNSSLAIILPTVLGVVGIVIICCLCYCFICNLMKKYNNRYLNIPDTEMANTLQVDKSNPTFNNRS